MGRWSRRLAPRYVAWLSLPAGAHWLDVGCGTGALAAAICEGASPASVIGCDPAAPFIDHARRELADPRTTFAVAGAGTLPARAGGFDGVVSLLALNFFPDPLAGVREMAARGHPGATISACVWDYAGRMEFLRTFWDAAVAEHPGARALDEGVRFPICGSAALTALFREGGLAAVETEALEIPTPFAGFADYWRPLLAGTGPAAAYVASLDATRRDALARRLEAALPRDAGGAIDLVARAWAVRGQVT